MGDLKTEIYFTTILEARYPRSKWWKGWLHSEASLWLVDGGLIRVFTWSSFCVCVCLLIFYPYGSISHIGLEHTSMNSFNLNYLFEDPLLKYVTLL